MAELERILAVVSAHRERMSVRDIARHAGLGATRVHQLVTSPQADCVEDALPVLREAGWPTPEDPLPGAEEQGADRLTEEAAAPISCAEWLASFAGGKNPVVNLIACRSVSLPSRSIGKRGAEGSGARPDLPSHPPKNISSL